MKTYTIDRLHFSGEGIAFDDQHKMLRIANAFPGEIIEAEDVSIRRRKQACLRNISNASCDRCAPSCPNWRRCAACQYQCLSPDAQDRIKRDNWLKLIQKFVKVDDACTVQYLPALETLKYRHRTDAALFTTETGPVIGIQPRLDEAVMDIIEHARMTGADVPDFSELEASDIMEMTGIKPVPLAGCALHAPELDALIRNVENALKDIDFPAQTRFGFEANGEHARITVYAADGTENIARKCAENLNQILKTSVVFQVLPPKGSHVYPKPESFGDPWYCYTHDIKGNPLYALKGAWTPVNPINAQLIRSALAEMTQKYTFDSVLELGCGCGTHTTLFENNAKEFVGIDASWPAIQSAQHNAEINQWKNTQFFTDTAEHYLDKRYYKGRRADSILMHSNRMPYSEKTAELCKRFGAKRIFIAAPTAFAIAQECRHFTALGYRLCALTLCNTLPMTYHMMAAASLELI